MFSNTLMHFLTLTFSYDYYSLLYYIITLSYSSQVEVDHLQPLFDKYLEKTMEFKRTHCKELVTITELNGVSSLCRLYHTLATPENGVSTTHLVSLSLPLSLSQESSITVNPVYPPR